MLSHLLYILTGLLAGCLAGLFGIGGGVVVVPALAAIFSLQNVPTESIMHMAIGTSLAAMVGTSLFSAYSHHKRGALQWNLFVKLVPGVIIGTLVGSLVAAILNTLILKIIFGIFLILVAFRLFFLSKLEYTGHKLPRAFIIVLMGLAVGFAAGLLGIGGGVIAIPLLSYFDIPLAVAAGVSAGLTVPISITGAISVIYTGWHMTGSQAGVTGYIYWPAAISISIFGIIGVLIGAILSKHLHGVLLKRIFALLLLTAGIELLR